MNTYEAKQARRRARLTTAAEKAACESDRRFQTARASIEPIPLGQPILVGHHSERRHRAAIARHDRNMRAAIDARDRSHDLAARAAAVGTAGISSDDPDAISKLREELSRLTARQEHMRAVNAAHRRFLTDPATLDASPLSEGDKAQIRAYKPAYSWEPHVFAPCQFKNNSGNIRRIEKRIGELERNAAQADQSPTFIECCGYTVVANFPTNRVQLKFPGRPADSVRKLLKSHGFRWSPSEGAWQRMLSSQATYLVTEGHLRSKIEALLRPHVPAAPPPTN